RWRSNMYERLATLALLFALVPASPACAAGDTSAQAESAQSARPAQTQGFTPVPGADLKSKLDEAARRGRAGSKSAPFWVAYTFDVRPGIAIDPAVEQFSGSMENFSGITVFRGKVNGVTVETRNLGLFLLHDPQGQAVTRAEIYNLERKREYSGYPVYWLGRAGNEESLNYLLGLVESARASRVAETATVALAVHDDRRVNDMLKGLVRQSKNREVRKTSAFWLGHLGGEHAFLSELVRNEREDRELREAAAHAVGLSRDDAALAALQALYGSVADKDVRAAVVHSAAHNENEPAASAFLLRVARTDRSPDVKRQAVHRLAQFDNEQTVEELMKIYAADRDEDVRQGVLHAFSQMTNARAHARLLEIARSGDDIESRAQAIHWLGQRKGEGTLDELMSIYNADRNREIREKVLHAFFQMDDPRAYAKLLEIARSGDDPEVRQQAIHWIGQRKGEAAVEDLSGLYRAERDTEVKSQILHAFFQMDSPRALDKLFEAARGGESAELRQQALHWLGQKAGERSLSALSEAANSSGADTDVQLQAVHAISQRPAAEAVPLLIQLARTHRNPEVRRAAIQRLTQSGDPRALEFIREVLTK
ncbi:MAG TPA: HEAT repeat domain-containing protein, partial [Pyrinomonadaceae bacterium]|nr:HEAT repeat domain-containing protein [Pyrinomonadaceae bacterium]